jgi:alpha-L-rhamnosidase
MKPSPLFRASLCILPLLWSVHWAAAGELHPADLRCEYTVNPLGLDAKSPRLSWIGESPSRAERQTACQVLVASTADLLASNTPDRWDSGKVASDDSAHVVYAGQPLASRAPCFWKVRLWDRDGNPSDWSQPAFWTMGLLSPADWHARWIDSAGPREANLAPGIVNAPVRYLRKSFAVDGPITHATLYVTALGLYDCRLNGQRVGDHLLAPDWTDYNKRVRYQAYDVTSLVRPGDNALGALIGAGWYAGHIGNNGFHRYGQTPALLAQLEITHADGTIERLVTDATWKSHAGPLLESDLMLGDTYDARREISGWDQPGCDDKDWLPANVRDEKPRDLDAQVSPPVRQLLERKTVALTEPSPGKWVFDLGQNMVGVVRLKVAAPAGTKVVLRHAEMLNPDGTLYTANLRSAISTDTYICRGGPEETWQPPFTFHGFRYVEITGLPDKPAPDTVTGIVLGSDTPRAGTFACSNPLINQLMSNIEWGQRGNYLSVPTDCPQRDERLGWMGDAQVFVRTATDLADVASFFTKWLVDVDDAQTPEGAFADVAPRVGTGAGTPAWGDAGVICPWTIYEAYGDKRLLETDLPAMTRWVEWCRAHSTNLLRETDRGNDYGDWLSIGANTPKDVIGTAYFAYSTHLLSEAYRAVGDAAKAAQYQALFAEIRDAFDQAYVTPDGRIKGNTQCDYAMALKFDLLPAPLRGPAVQYLADDIAAHDNHLTTGFVGVSYLLPVLTAGGRLDTAYALLNQDTFPSWLFSVKHGATTIWERWDGWTPEKGFQNPAMNSFNHYSLGSCGEWLYDTVAGIGWDGAAPGYKKLMIRPRPGGDIASVAATRQTMYGRVAANWTCRNGAFTLDVTIPANTAARVILPAADAAAVTEGGQRVAEVADIAPAAATDGDATFEIGSGTYQFACPFATAPKSH